MNKPELDRTKNRELAAKPRDTETENQLWQDPPWTCPQCRFVNLAIRERCRNCGFDSAVAHAGCC
jgi:hypothetical protein